MRIFLLFTLYLSFACSISAQTEFFVNFYGGNDLDGGLSVEQTSDSGYIISGTSWSFSRGQDDMYLIKLDQEGNKEWSKNFGGFGSDRAYDVHQTNDGGYILIGSTGSLGAGARDVYLLKTDANGDSLWSKTYGGPNLDFALSGHQTKDGGYIIVGHTASFGKGGYDVYLLKTDANGDTTWAKTFGGSKDDWAEEVQECDDGGFIIAGHTFNFGANKSNFYLIKTDKNGVLLWSRAPGTTEDEGFNSIKQTSDGGYIVAGYTYFYGDGNTEETYLMKVDSLGSETWGKVYRFSGVSAAYSVSINADDTSYILGGYARTSILSFLSDNVTFIKTTSKGDTIWTRKYGTSDDERAYSIKPTFDGGYILVGKSFNDTSGTSNVYVIKSKSNGAISFIKHIPITPLESLKIYPNPFSESAHISIPEHLNNLDNLTFRIYDILGVEVKKFENINTGHFTIHRDGLRSGMYLYLLTDQNRLLQSGKILVQ